MFTGIIEEIGEITSIIHATSSMRLTIRCKKVLAQTNVGDSIAVNGVCLTVVSLSTDFFQADVMPETFKATTIAQLSIGDVVNLERAVAANGRFGGHFVSGHVDGIGEITVLHQVANAQYMTIAVPSTLLPYLIKKGSIAVDGVSLTIFEVSEHTFTISLIPVTQRDTILHEKVVGSKVNIECDMIAKYMDRLLQQRTLEQPQTVSKTLLVENGFI